MRKFRIKRLNCSSVPCGFPEEHQGYYVGGHNLQRSMFERLTGHKWERGYRTFRLVQVPRTKRGTKRG